MPEKAVARRDLVWRTLKQYDLLGTTDQFYESTLLVARTLNWSHHARESLLERHPGSLVVERGATSQLARRCVHPVSNCRSLPHTSETGMCT